MQNKPVGATQNSDQHTENRPIQLRRCTPASVTSQSIGQSCGCGSTLPTRPSSKPTPTVTGAGASAASVRSK